MLQLELHHGKLGLSTICQILKEHDEEHRTREYIDCDIFKAGFEKAKMAKSGKAGTTSYGEAMKWMTIVLDHWTHLKHFSISSDPRRTVFVTAKQDKFVPREWVEDVRTIWPGKKNKIVKLLHLLSLGCNVQFVDGGHVTAYLLQQKKLR